MSDIDDLIDRLTERQQREFALACARRVQHLMRDPRSIAALDVAERHLRGEATDKELDAARVAAWDAARDARRAAVDAAQDAWDAAQNAARAAAASWNAAQRASWASEWAAWTAEWAARAAAWAAERAWQREELERMLKEGGGA